jgi:hypothetical protein
MMRMVYFLLVVLKLNNFRFFKHLLDISDAMLHHEESVLHHGKHFSLVSLMERLSILLSVIRNLDEDGEKLFIFLLVIQSQ